MPGLLSNDDPARRKRRNIFLASKPVSAPERAMLPATSSSCRVTPETEDLAGAMKPVSIITALFLGALCGGPGVAGAAAQDCVPIEGAAALRALLADQTLSGHTREGKAWTEYYWPDGRSSYDQDACVIPGQWRVSEKGACFGYPTLESDDVSCYLLFRDNGQIDFVPDDSGDSDAEFIAETMRSGNAERLPATLTGNCGG
jgi:hypothetical protein